MNIDNFLDELCELDPEYTKDLISLEEKYDCEISCYTEKHSALQLTYFYEVDFGKSELFYVEIENGINNGTQLNSSEWGSTTKRTTKIVDVLNDIKLDDNFYKECPSFKRKAQAILDTNKSKLFEFHQRNNYDNYVTCGNSKMKLDPILRKLSLDYIYEPKEVDINFV